MESTRWFLDEKGLNGLLKNLSSQGFTNIGPRLVQRDSLNPVFELGQIESIEDLPRGWHEEQGPGRYEVVYRNDHRLFSHSPGANAWKRYLQPPRQRIGDLITIGDISVWKQYKQHRPRYALFGVRPCDARAIFIMDRIFIGAQIPDEEYRARRDEMLIIVTHCGETWETCFCESMGSGPRATDGFDIGISEILEEYKHYFILEGATDRGRMLVAEVALREATSDEWNEACKITDRARESLSRTLKTEGLPELLMSSLEHPNWNVVADRCLSCANCTMVCPTCFCSTVEDITGFSTERSERWRRWISCFEEEFSAIHSGVVRSSTRSRYRQWLTHKLATWFDQYGTSGCVGCGRCITWCPVGIDITEEVTKFCRPESGEEVSDGAR